MANDAHIGQGWSFPIRLSGSGGISMSTGHQEIQEAIRMILGTAPGERPMRPDFGCRIHELTFAPTTGETIGLARHYVEDALGWWEPRIDVIDVDVEADPDSASGARLMVSIRYEIRATKDERTLVYPFYLIHDE